MVEVGVLSGSGRLSIEKTEASVNFQNLQKFNFRDLCLICPRL